MANELSVGLTAQYEDAAGSFGIVQGIEQLIVSLATAKLLHTTLSATTAGVAVPVGDIVSRGTMILINRDPTNFVSVYTASGQKLFAKLWPTVVSPNSQSGINFCVVHLGSDAQSPYLVANTATCDVEVFIMPL